jgi:hypothetical protein
LRLEERHRNEWPEDRAKKEKRESAEEWTLDLFSLALDQVRIR